MATQELDLTTSPKNVVSELNLTVDESYSIQSVGIWRVFIAEVASEPDASSRAAKVFEYKDSDDYTIGTNGIWAWAEVGGGKLIINDIIEP